MANNDNLLKRYTKNKRNTRIEGRLHTQLLLDLRYSWDVSIHSFQFTDFYKYKLQLRTSTGAVQSLVSKEEGTINLGIYFLEPVGIEKIFISDPDRVMFKWTRGANDVEEDIYINTFMVTLLEQQNSDKGLFVYTEKPYKQGDEIPYNEVLVLESEKPVLGVDQKERLYFKSKLIPHFTTFNDPIYPIYPVDIYTPAIAPDSIEITSKQYAFFGNQKVWGIKNENAQFIPTGTKISQEWETLWDKETSGVFAFFEEQTTSFKGGFPLAWCEQIRITYQGLDDVEDITLNQPDCTRVGGDDGVHTFTTTFTREDFELNWSVRERVDASLHELDDNPDNAWKCSIKTDNWEEASVVFPEGGSTWQFKSYSSSGTDVNGRAQVIKIEFIPTELVLISLPRISELKTTNTIFPIEFKQGEGLLKNADAMLWFAHIFSNNTNQLKWRSEWFNHNWAMLGREDPISPFKRTGDFLYMTGMPGKYPAGSIIPINTTSNMWYLLFNLWDFDSTGRGLLGAVPTLSNDSRRMEELSINPILKNGKFINNVLSGTATYNFHVDNVEFGFPVISAISESAEWSPAGHLAPPPALLEAVDKKNWMTARDWTPRLPFISSETTSQGFQYYDGKNEEDSKYWWLVLNWPTSALWWRAFWFNMNIAMEGEFIEDHAGIRDGFFEKASSGEYDINLLLEASSAASEDAGITFNMAAENSFKIMFNDRFKDDFGIEVKAVEIQVTNVEEFTLGLYSNGVKATEIKLPTSFSINKLGTKTRVIF